MSCPAQPLIPKTPHKFTCLSFCCYCARFLFATLTTTLGTTPESTALYLACPHCAHDRAACITASIAFPYGPNSLLSCNYWIPAVEWTCWACGVVNEAMPGGDDGNEEDSQGKEMCRKCGYRRKMGGCTVRKRWEVGLNRLMGKIGLVVPEEWVNRMRNSDVVLDMPGSIAMDLRR